MRRITAGSVILVSMLALSGCAAASSDSGVEGPVAQPGIAVDQPSDASGGGAVSSDGSLQSEADRQVITTGYVTVTVEEPRDAAAEATRIVESIGGRVDSRTEYAPIDGDKGSATLTLRFPAETLTATLDKLEALGEVQEVSISTSDVTMQSQDLEARITALQASVDRLLGLLATATDTDQLVAIESALSSRQADLESLEAQQRYLDDQVAMTTVSLNLISVADTPADTPDTFLSGIVTGWNALVAFFGAVLVGAGVLVPWLALAGIATLIVLAIVRVMRRRRAGKAATESD